MQLNSEFRFVMHHQNSLPYSVSDHVHDCYEIVYYMSGEGVTKIGSKEFKYKKDTFCVIPPHIVHSEYAITETELIYIGFDYNNTWGELPLCMLIDPDKSILDIMLKIKSEVNSRLPVFEALLEAYPHICIVKILRLALENNVMPINKENIVSETQKEPIDYAANFILDNFSKEINLHDLSRSIGYSYHHFRHLFKESYGFSPKQFIIKTRINMAKNLLSTTDFNIETISKMCGYSSPSQFIAAFKKDVLVTPYIFRKTWGEYPESANFIK